MKKLLLITILIAIVYACNRKTAASSSTPAVAKPSAEAHAKLVAEGQTVYTNRCGRCHALKPVTKFDQEAWSGILESMIPMAKLNSQDSTRVTAYVMAHAKK